jgi:hypothetical protein
VPATYEDVITGSAFPDVDGEAGGEGISTCTRDGDETFARFSSYGEDVDIAAPGSAFSPPGATVNAYHSAGPEWRRRM